MADIPKHITDACIDDATHLIIPSNYMVSSLGKDKEHRKCTAYICQKCLRIFEHKDIINRHYALVKEEKNAIQD